MAKFIDIHSHIAWGIDDGMPSIEDAQSALESAKADGFVGICSTPHFIPGQLDVSIYNEIVSRQMELKKMREMSEAELNAELLKMKKDLFNLRFQHVTGQLENPIKMRETKRDIARVKTIIREKELAKVQD